MYTPPFCPYVACSLHVDLPDQKWWSCDVFHATKAFGSVQRYVCHSCGRTFSEQTFSVHFYAKFVIDYRRLERLSASSMSLRALSREFRCSCDSVTNRNDRIARQGIALHTTLRQTATTTEAVCFDGLVSFDRSQYFPSDIGLSITAKSRYIYAASHATTRRSGSMRDEKKEYVRAFRKQRLYLNQEEVHRRKTACHSRNPANSMNRLYSYIVWHNYNKRYLIKWPVHMKATAAEKAGISCDDQSRLRQHMFTRRSFLSHLHLAAID